MKSIDIINGHFPLSFLSLLLHFTIETLLILIDWHSKLSICRIVFVLFCVFPLGLAAKSIGHIVWRKRKERERSLESALKH